MTPEQWSKLQKARELASNATQTNDWAVVLEYLAERQIRQKVGFTATVAVKKEIFQRDKSCQFENKVTGNICGSKWNLHVDHIQPKWASGTDKKENLRILCQKHNHHVYREQAGIRRVT